MFKLCQNYKTKRYGIRKTSKSNNWRSARSFKDLIMLYAENIQRKFLEKGNNVKIILLNH